MPSSAEFKTAPSFSLVVTAVFTPTYAAAVSAVDACLQSSWPWIWTWLRLRPGTKLHFTASRWKTYAEKKRTVSSASPYRFAALQWFTFILIVVTLNYECCHLMILLPILLLLLLSLSVFVSYSTVRTMRLFLWLPLPPPKILYARRGTQMVTGIQ